MGILYIFAITSLGVYGVVMAGWSANNKWGLLGSLRSSAQMFSYELSLGLLLAEPHRHCIEQQARRGHQPSARPHPERGG